MPVVGEAVFVIETLACDETAPIVVLADAEVGLPLLPVAIETFAVLVTTVPEVDS